MNGRNTAIWWQRRTLGVMLMAALSLVAGIALPSVKTGGAVARADSTPTGKLVFTGADGIYVQRMDGSAAVRVWQAPAGADAGSARWSPDGSRIAFEGPDGNIWAMNADGSDAHAVSTQAVAGSGCGEDGCTQAGTRADSPRWSPNGQSLSYRLAEELARGSIWTVGVAAGSVPQRVAGADDLCIFNEGWSPAGVPLFSRCATQSSVGNATYLSAPSATTSAPQSLVAGSQLAFSLDGRRLAFAGMAYRGGSLTVTLFVGAADGTGAQAVGADGQEPQWSSGGLLAYQVDGAGGWTMRVYNPATGTVTFVGAGTLGGWTPDGAWLYYTVLGDAGPTIWRIHPDGTGATRVTAGNFPDWGLG